jgi:hypothetical protein
VSILDIKLHACYKIFDDANIFYYEGYSSEYRAEIKEFLINSQKTLLEYSFLRLCLERREGGGMQIQPEEKDLRFIPLINSFILYFKKIYSRYNDDELHQALKKIVCVSYLHPELLALGIYYLFDISTLIHRMPIAQGYPKILKPAYVYLLNIYKYRSEKDNFIKIGDKLYPTIPRFWDPFINIILKGLAIEIVKNNDLKELKNLNIAIQVFKNTKILITLLGKNIDEAAESWFLHAKDLCDEDFKKFMSTFEIIFDSVNISEEELKRKINFSLNGGFRTLRKKKVNKKRITQRKYFKLK